MQNTENRFKHDGLWYIAVEQDGCRNCDFKKGRQGCKVMVPSVDECASVAAINNYGVCVVFHDGEFTTLHKSGISPLGTPEEKAQRLRSEWIPVSEQMPENEGTYFCLGHNGTPFVCLFRTTKYEGKIWLRSTGTKRVYGITHWMPLPAAPVKDGE